MKILTHKEPSALFSSQSLMAELPPPRMKNSSALCPLPSAFCCKSSWGLNRPHQQAQRAVASVNYELRIANF